MVSPPSVKDQMMLSMSKFFTISLLSLIYLLGICGCGGPDEGIYTGKIGKKRKVEIRVTPDDEVILDGYWQEPLKGEHQRGSLKGEDMDALVFEGPASKKFKLRILYQEEENELIIRAIQSRNYGPGARYVSTEEESVFDPPPRLLKR